MNNKTSIAWHKIALLFFAITISINLPAQNWEQLSDPPFFKHHSNGFGFNGKAYVMEGVNQDDGPDGISKEVWEYTALTDSWVRLADFPGEARAIAIGDDWNGKYYYGFGADADNYLNDLWEFDPVTGIFTQLPSCPCQGRTHPALIAHNDKIFMGSGRSTDGDLDDWWIYDMNSQEWTEKEDIPGGNRHHPFFFGIDNNVYVGGGHRTNWNQFNIITEEWTQIDNTPAGRVAGSQLNYKGKGLIIGGDDASHNHVPDNESFMSYDPATEEWEYLPELPNRSRWAPSSFILDDILYFFGGLSFNIEGDASMWKFDLSLLSCTPPQDLNAVNVTDNYAELFWSSNPEAISDTLKWRKVGNSTWNSIPDPQAVYALMDLEVCQEYEFIIITECSSNNTNSEAYRFRTKGCGSCIDLDFCSTLATLNGEDEFINKVQINDYVNISGSNGGYANFAVPEAESIVLGETFELSLEPGFAGSSIPSSFTVWVDYNANGNFETSEIILQESFVENELTRTIEVPSTATPGLSRMRVLYRFIMSPSPCDDGSFDWGEAEDYCINITSPTTSISKLDEKEQAIWAFPNPFQNTIKLSGNFQTNERYQVKIVDVTGATIWSILNFDLANDIDLSSVPSGVYFITIENESFFSKTIKLVK